ncbi:MAG: hypothetical protein RLZZ246_1344 [Planctomycetota bacterium]|jgi:hypothetical protein
MIAACSSPCSSLQAWLLLVRRSLFRPLDGDPKAIREIGVWGIVVGGVKHPVSAIAPRPAVTAAGWGAGHTAVHPGASTRTAPMSMHTDAPASARHDRVDPSAPSAPRAFGGRYASPAAMQDPAMLIKHLDGCTQEFWRTLGRDHDGTMAAAMEGDVRSGSRGWHPHR